MKAAGASGMLLTREVLIRSEVTPAQPPHPPTPQEGGGVTVSGIISWIEAGL